MATPFRDADGCDHPAGEEWELKAVLFVPYDGELLLIVSLDDKPDFYVIPLQDSEPEQLGLTGNILKHITRLDTQS
ncbi:MAG: DUF3601 domain-containing protein [Pirellulales bacterium]|nr:DUF3601 domain-containing protein [Pirellulales bacterium]